MVSLVHVADKRGGRGHPDRRKYTIEHWEKARRMITHEQALVILEAAERFDKACQQMDGLIEGAVDGRNDPAICVPIVNEFLEARQAYENAVNTRGVLS